MHSDLDSEPAVPVGHPFQVGYDLEVVQMPRDAREAREAFLRANIESRRTGQTFPRSAWELTDRYARYEFHAGGGTLRLLANRMVDLGMAFEFEIPRPELSGDATEQERWRARGQTGRAGIPLHKLSSNDGWIVTTVEIDAALAALARNAPTLDAPSGDRMSDSAWEVFEATWGEWVDFLQVASAHGGFIVN